MEQFTFPALEGERVQPAGPSREQLVATARDEADAITAEARARGHEEGLAAGMAEAQAHLDPARAALVEARSALDRIAGEAVPAIEARAVELAIALAEKILHTALDIDPALVCSVVNGALRRVVSRERIVLEVCPEDEDLIKATLARDQTDLGALRQVEIVADRRVPRGGCIVRTVEGEIDARVEQQLERAATLLRNATALAA
jgi:flagellar biosynthesis/type III secretory pathway protein FliH